MRTDRPLPLLIPARLAVLLIFVPTGSSNRQQRASVVHLADTLQDQLTASVRVLCIDETNHPDVVRSFDVTQTPTFVLVRQGVELWRLVGMPADGLLQQLTQTTVLT